MTGEEPTTESEGNETLTHNTDEIIVLLTVVTGCVIGVAAMAAYLFFGAQLDFEQIIAILGIFVLTPMSYVFGKTRS